MLPGPTPCSRSLRRLYAICTAVAILLAGCDSPDSTGDSLATTGSDGLPSKTWIVRNLVHGAIDKRIATGLRADGYFAPSIDRQWMPAGKQHASLISQSRIIYTTSRAYELTGEQRYLDAARSAGDFLLKHFPNRQWVGLWYRRVDATGKPLLRGFHLYGHAHVIFALSHLYQASGDARYLEAALATWHALDVTNTLQGANQRYHLRALNSTMHLFEAYLVLYRLTGKPFVRTELELLANHLVERFYDPKREFFV